MDKEKVEMKISKKDDNKKDKNNWLKIIVPPTNKHKVKTTKAMDEHIIAKHPFRAVMSGSSGSGKSCLLLNLLSNKRMYANYFDIIFILSPTADQLDDSYDLIKKQKKTKLIVINDLNEDIVEQILETNRQIILERKVHKAPRLLLCYDDIIAQKDFMKSKGFLHSFVAGRHYNASIIVCTQKYNALPRTVRLQCNWVCYFLGSLTEDQVLAENFTPPGYTKKEFLAMIAHATSEPYQFLSINCQADRKDRYRIGLEHIMRLKR